MASIKCGNCKGSHASVREVKDCYAVPQHQTGLVTAPVVERPSAKAERAAAPARARLTEADVPEGRFALRTQAGAVNEIAFYKVSWWGEGRSRFSVYRIIGGHADERMEFKASLGVMRRIAEDVNGAFVLYGKESETCGVCGIHLTNDVSRARGMGDICAGKRGVA